MTESNIDELQLNNSLENTEMQDSEMQDSEIYDEMTNENLNINNQINNLIHYQDNINNNYRVLNNDLNFSFNCLPYVFFHDYENYKHIEFTNKLILPKYILNELSKYENINYPLYFKINNYNFLFSVLEFVEDIDAVYVSNEMFRLLKCEENSLININFNNQVIDKGTKIIIQPHNSNFYDIQDAKKYFETHILNNYSILQDEQIISLPHDIDRLYFNIIKCEPKSIISIIDTDLEVEFIPSLDYVEQPKIKKPVVKKTEVKQTEIKKEESNNEENKQFVSFSGKGYSLK